MVRGPRCKLFVHLPGPPTAVLLDVLDGAAGGGVVAESLLKEVVTRADAQARGAASADPGDSSQEEDTGRGNLGFSKNKSRLLHVRFYKTSISV